MKQYLFLLCLLCACAVQAQPFPHVIWDRSGMGDSSLYGYKILPLGDQNNDGYADWAVLAAGWGPPGQASEARLDFYHGGNPPGVQPYRIIRGDTIHGALAGWGAADVLGDVNGDGYTDWFVKTLNAQHNGYVISIYYGGSEADTAAQTTFDIAGPDEFGTIGDFNGDGFSDLYWFHNVAGYVDVYYGGVSIDTIPDWTIHNAPSTQMVFPWSFGDLNGDGYSDYVSADVSSNTTYIFLGGAHPDTVPAYTWPNMAWPQAIVPSLIGNRIADLVLHARETGPICFGGTTLRAEPDVTLSFPCGMSSADEAVSVGDINHDGYNDLVLVSSYCENSDWGVLSLYLGHPWLNPQPVWTIEGRGWQNLVSIQTAAGLGDVNGDGIDDIAIGAYDGLDFDGWRGRCIIVAGDTMLRAEADPRFSVEPASFSVQAFPNPFNASTTLTFSLPTPAVVTMEVFDVLGRCAWRKELGRMTAGEKREVWDAAEMTSGVYFVRVNAGELARVEKVMLLR